MTTTNLGMTIPTVGADTDNWGNDLNTDLGLIDAFAGKLMPGPEITLASASTTDIGSAASTAVAISGTTTINSFGAVANCIRYVRFTGALTLTHNATSLILLGSVNRTAAVGACGVYRSDGSGNWRELAYFDQDISSGAAVKLGSLAIAGVSLGSNAFAMNGNMLVGGNAQFNGNVSGAGSIFAGPFTSAPAGNGSFTCMGFGNTTIYGNASIESSYGGGFTIQSGSSGGVMLAAGGTSWSSVSEREKKTGFQPIVDPLSIVANLRAELGRYKSDDPQCRLRPFVFYEDAEKWWPYAAAYQSAQTLIEEYPRTGRRVVKDLSEYKGVSYELYVPLLLAAFHQQISINSDLSARIRTLEATM